MSNRVCKFYLQGTCRFGDSCKFSHSATCGNNLPNSTFNRFSDPNRFTYLNPDEKLKQKMKQKVGSVESIAEIIQNDFKHWLPSKVWPFSCYSVNSIDNLFPELNDLSTDEARHAFLSASGSGSIDRHIHEITTEGRKVQEFIDSVAKASKDDVLALVRQRVGNESESSATPTNSGNIFSQPTSNSTFGNPSGVSNPFSSNSSNSASSFGGQSVFSNSAPAQKPETAFGSSSTNVFGSNASSTFGSITSSPFGPSTNNLFVSNSSSAVNSNSNIFKSSPFSNQPTNNQANPFLSAASNSVSSTGFGQPSFGQSNPEKSAVFGQSNSGQSVFGQPNSGQSGFGQPGFGQSALAQSNSGQSVFGQPNSGQSAFGKTNSGHSAFGQTNSGQSAFGQTNSGQSAFGQTNSGQSAFGQANSGQSVFGQTNSGQSAFGQTNLGQSAFGQPNASTTQSSLEAQSNIGISGKSETQPAAIPKQSTPALNQNSTTSLTGISTSAASQNPFSNVPTQPQHIEEDLSRIPKLTEEDLIQYRNKAFEWGKIPECPPPPELCV